MAWQVAGSLLVFGRIDDDDGAMKAARSFQDAGGQAGELKVSDVVDSQRYKSDAVSCADVLAGEPLPERCSCPCGRGTAAVRWGRARSLFRTTSVRRSGPVLVLVLVVACSKAALSSRS